jgi:ADP-ribose pyrophosphatase YjhB (NUDIX family)
MPNQQPTVTDTRGRQFACSVVAVLGIIVDEDRRLLLLAHPARRGTWEVINGALEAEETVLEGVLREVREEAGPDVRVRPLGTVHASTFRYDDTVQYLISLCYLLAYEGGEIQPGDDMRGSQYRWWSLEELANEGVQVVVPRQKWVLERAVELYHLWKGQTLELQHPLDPTARTKYQEHERA